MTQSQTQSKAAVRPEVGQHVSVVHMSDGNGKIIGCNEDIAPITAVYLDGTVRIGCGDVYKVKPYNHKTAMWRTVGKFDG